MKLRVILHQERPGAFHMAVDRALLESVGAGASPPTLRIYTWRPHAVSLGRGQRCAHLLDWRKCKRAGVDVVVRPSGGRAVLHGDDVTYAAVFPAGGFPDAGGVRATYRRIAGLLAEALAALGVKVDLAASRGTGGPSRVLPCFTCAARDELLVDGKKIVGSAQRRTRDAVLQHGAILAAGDQAQLADLVADPQAAGALRDNLAGRTVTLERALGRPVAFEEVAEALLNAAEKVLGIRVAEAELTSEELGLADKFTKECLPSPCAPRPGEAGSAGEGGSLLRFPCDGARG